MLSTILLVFAFVFAVIAAVVIERVDRPPLGVHFGWLAVTFYLASLLFGGHLLH